MKQETSEHLREAFEALRASRALLIAALDQYAADTDADEDQSKQSQYERKIAALEARFQMAENEYKIWEVAARQEGVEAERDRAIQQAKDERKRSENSEAASRSNHRSMLVVIACGAACTLVAGAIPVVCSRSPAPPVVQVEVHPLSQPVPVVSVTLQMPSPSVSAATPPHDTPPNKAPRK